MPEWVAAEHAAFYPPLHPVLHARIARLCGEELRRQLERRSCGTVVASGVTGSSIRRVKPRADSPARRRDGQLQVPHVPRCIRILARSATEQFPPEERRKYNHPIRAAFSTAGRAPQRDDMGIDGQERENDFARKRCEPGEVGGRKEGREQGPAAALLRVPAARGGAAGAAQRRTAGTCDDADRLARRLERAATATTPRQVFGDDAWAPSRAPWD